MTCIADTASINLTVAAGQLSADLVVDPGAGLAPNPIVVNPAGVYVIGSDGWIPLPVTLAFSSADAPTFVATTSADLRSFIGPGDKIRLVQTGVPAYFWVTAITGTQITLYGGTLYTLAATPVSLPYFSKVKSPIGFPLDPDNWTVETLDTSARTQAAPVSNTWYNPGGVQLVCPIGKWRLYWEAYGYYTTNVAQNGADVYITLSTANNSESDKKMSAGNGVDATGVTKTVRVTGHREKIKTLAAKETQFLNIMCDNVGGTASLVLANDIVTAAVRAELAYL